MNFDFEKLMAKVSGENVEDFSKRVISDSDKAQINFALDQMFQGLSLIEWMNKITLANAWRISLDKMRDYIFGLTGPEYIVDYLHIVVFEHRQKILKMIADSLHANEYINYPTSEYPKLKDTAEEKIKTAINILTDILSTPRGSNVENIKPAKNIETLSRTKENKYERTRK